MKRNVGAILTALLLCALLSASALAASVASPTSDFYVNDYANVLSGDTEQHIMDVSVALEQETGAQVVVLTVDSLDGMDIESYGLEVGREWGIGDDDKDNGLLLLLSVGDREIRLEVGYGLEGAINDAKAGRLIRNYAQDYYASDNFDSGTLELYNAAVSLVREEYGLSPLSGYESADDDQLFDSNEPMDAGDWIYLILFMLVLLRIVGFPIFILIINIFRSVAGKKPLRGGCLMGGGGGYHGGYRGGRGGGGFGGFGGGGFSGGGGSFGGGGASGKF